MQTKSGLRIDVSEMPGHVWIRARGKKQDTAVFMSTIQRMLEKDSITGTESGDPGVWGVSVTPKAAWAVASSVKAGVTFTVSEVHTFRGLLRSAAKYALHPPHITYVELPAWMEQRIAAARPLLEIETIPAELQKKLDVLFRDLLHQTGMPTIGQLKRCRISRRSLAALRAAESVPSDHGHDMRWARQLCLQMGYEGCGPDAWEPCAPTDEYARMVVLP